MAFNNSSQIPVCITFVGIGVTFGDVVILTSVDVGTLVEDIPVHAVSNRMGINNKKLDLILNGCLIGNDLFNGEVSYHKIKYCLFGSNYKLQSRAKTLNKRV